MVKNLGIYIHIPFCASKCAYCDFYSLAGCEQLIPKYQYALLRHIKESAPQLDGYITDTVYFGGGTPSYYGAGRLIHIFNTLKKCGNVLLDSEVTVEVNPDSISLFDLKRLRRAGFNRLSVGIQSSDDKTLKSIGRRHTFAQAEETVRNARTAGFDNINIDLIYGLPSQSKEDWADTLSRAAALKPEHFSCYGLKIEEGTPLYLYKDSPFIPDGDTQADMYLYTVEALNRCGYKQYEISNFALRGFESKHNLKYWQGDEYFGFGAAAHSYIGNLRFSYLPNIAEYCENVVSGKTIIDQCEEISKWEQAGEYLMLRLRTVYGISEEEYYSIYPCNFDLVKDLLKFYEENGWIVKNNNRWNFTPQGLLSNALIGEIVDTQTRQRISISTPWKKSEYEMDYQFSMFDKKAEEIQLFHGIF